MPTIKNITDKYRLFFYSFDCKEPKHVHVQKGRDVCKFWLEPVVLSKNHGYSPRELNNIRELIYNKKIKILEAWDEHCGKSK